MSTDSQLKQAIDANDIEGVKALTTRQPALHGAAMGYGEDGPLTWVAECRVPREAPGPARLAMADWMIAHGPDVHQGGDGPLMRAALNGDRIPMMELLVSRGADVNAWWHGNFPIIFAPCESMDAAALKWLLDHGANPNCRDHGYQIGGHAYPGTALDYLIAGYARSLHKLSACIDLLARLIGAEPGLVHQRFPELDCGQTGGRSLLLRGATLLHVAAEYGDADAVARLLDRGADVNADSTLDAAGVGGQTAIFQAVTQYDDFGLRATQKLIERGADLSLCMKLPGDYERPREIVECTPLGHALRFGGGSETGTIELLKQRGAVA